MEITIRTPKRFFSLCGYIFAPGWCLVNGKGGKKGKEFPCHLSPTTPIPPKHSSGVTCWEWMSPVESLWFVNNNFLIHPIARQHGRNGLCKRSLVSASPARTANSLIRSWSQCWSWCSLASKTNLLKSFVVGEEKIKSPAADTVQASLKLNTWRKVSGGRCLESAGGKVSSEY